MMSSMAESSPKKPKKRCTILSGVGVKSKGIGSTRVDPSKIRGAIVDINAIAITGRIGHNAKKQVGRRDVYILNGYVESR